MDIDENVKSQLKDFSANAAVSLVTDMAGYFSAIKGVIGHAIDEGLDVFAAEGYRAARREVAERRIVELIRIGGRRRHEIVLIPCRIYGLPLRDRFDPPATVTGMAITLPPAFR